MRRTLLAVVLGLGLLVGAFAVGRGTAPDHHPSSGPAAKPDAADIGFAQDMATHHDQAVLMAGLALSRGTTAVRAIGQSILTSQGQEVGLLRGWLRLWNAPATDEHPMGWMGMGMAPDSLMPGMATSPQLARLYQLSGKPFDVLFLQLMVRHHEGGLLMTNAALNARTLPVTKTAAQGISAEQIEELGTMRALLAADGAKALPQPTVG